MSDQPMKNTDRELWRETPGDYYAPSLHVTEHGGIGINVGGLVFVKSIRAWHLLARQAEESGRVGKAGGQVVTTATGYDHNEPMAGGPSPVARPEGMSARQPSEPAPDHAYFPGDKCGEPAPTSATRYGPEGQCAHGMYNGCTICNPLNQTAPPSAERLDTSCCDCHAPQGQRHMPLCQTNRFHSTPPGKKEER